MSDINLKPCPFCGRSAMYCNKRGVFTGKSTGKYVTCSNDRCIPFPQFFTVANWNARPIEDTLRARVAELEHKLVDLSEADPYSFNWMEKHLVNMLKARERIHELEKQVQLLLENKDK